MLLLGIGVAKAGATSMLTRGLLPRPMQTLGATDNVKRSLRQREPADAIFFKAGYRELYAGGRRCLHALFQHDIAALARLDLVNVQGWSQ